jgi:hypothetical protein
MRLCNVESGFAPVMYARERFLALPHGVLRSTTYEDFGQKQCLTDEKSRQKRSLLSY